MAYSNWGAEVWCDGNAMHQNCDVTPQMVIDNETYVHYLQHYISTADGAINELGNMYHAVVGDKDSGVLVCLYKAYPGPIFIIKDGTALFHKPWDSDFDWHEEMEANIELPNGIAISLNGNFDPMRISCNFTDATGRKWSAVSGYLIGEGHRMWG